MQNNLFEDRNLKTDSGKRRVVRHGAPTNDLVLSAYSLSNSEVFCRILDLYYVAPGSAVADVTFGKGEYQLER